MDAKTQFLLKGFSLIELMITLLILSILIAMALPQLSDVSNEISFNSLQQNLISSLLYSRSEAIKNGSNTLVCPSLNNATCSVTPQDWSQGWIIVTDEDLDGAYDPAIDTLLRAQSIESTARITWSNSSPVIFEGDGTVNSTSSGSFKLCDSRAVSTVARGIAINLSGRVRSSDSVTCP
jgi:type IV fimbrial biogenesis protein FimT